MAINYLSVLLRLASVKHPVEQPGSRDWNKIEAELNFEFPEDYKDLVSGTGAGFFGINLYLRNPVSTSEYTLLSRDGIIKHFELVADLKESANVALYPDPLGAVIIASADRQDFLLRPKNRTSKLSELLWWNVDTGELRTLNMSFSQFIHDLYFGLILDDWVTRFRESLWCRGSAPFFTQSGLR